MGVATCLKYTVIIFNGILAIIGIVIIGVGSFVLTRVESSGGKYFYIGVIAIGCLILLIACCGCAGGLTENYCLLLTHSILMVLLTIFTTVITVLTFVYKKKFASLIISILMIEALCKYFSACKQHMETVVAILGYVLSGFACVELIWVLLGVYVGINMHKGKLLISEKSSI